MKKKGTLKKAAREVSISKGKEDKGKKKMEGQIFVPSDLVTSEEDIQRMLSEGTFPGQRREGRCGGCDMRMDFDPFRPRFGNF